MCLKEFFRGLFTLFVEVWSRKSISHRMFIPYLYVSQAKVQLKYGAYPVSNVCCRPNDSDSDKLCNISSSHFTTTHTHTHTHTPTHTTHKTMQSSGPSLQRRGSKARVGSYDGTKGGGWGPHPPAGQLLLGKGYWDNYWWDTRWWDPHRLDTHLSYIHCFTR